MKNISSLLFDVNSNKKFISKISNVIYNNEIYFVGNF
jgi:hypothetical protein